MSGQFLNRHLLASGFDHPLSGQRGPHANGVAQGNFIAAHLIQRFGDIRYFMGGNVALVRAAQHAGDVAPHPHAYLVGAGKHRLKARQRLGNRAVDVLLGERFRCRTEYRDFLNACLQGAF